MRVKDSAIASSINAIAIGDLQGNLTYVNPSFLKLWGYDRKEVLGKPASKFWQTKEKAEEIIGVLRDGGGGQVNWSPTKKMVHCPMSSFRQAWLQMRPVNPSA